MARFLIILAAAFLLSGCTELQSLRARFGAPAPVHSLFSRTLETEYVNLADYQHIVRGQPAYADHFRDKAEKARDGGMPLPDKPDVAGVPDADRARITEAYDNLLRALQGGAWIDNGPLAAMAQTRYDCWIAYLAEAKAASHDYGCRAKFDEAMEVLGAVQALQSQYVIYFDQNSIGMNDANMDRVSEAARAIRLQPDHAAVLNAYAAKDETGELARNLTIRRLMAVRNALAQDGAALDRVLAGKVDAAPGNGPLDQQRRVEIDVLPRDQAASQRSAKAESLLPETFGSAEPVF